MTTLILKTKGFLFMLMALLTILIFSVPSSDVYSSSPSLQSGTEFTVLAGYEDFLADGLEVQAFLPENVTVKVGDTVNWKFTLLEPHTVTFLGAEERPNSIVVLPDGRAAISPSMIFSSNSPQEYDGIGLVNSGLPPLDIRPEEFSFLMTFTQPGAFPYVCLLHPFMTGMVTVLDDSAPPVFPPETVEEDGETQRDGFIAELNRLREEVGSPESGRTSNGVRDHRVLAGISTLKADLMYFDRPDISVFAGDRVTWSWEATGAPHNVMFVPQGQDFPAPFLEEPQDAGPPNFPFNPVVFEPSGGDVFDSNTLQNSGMRFNPVVPPPPGYASGATYSLTFDQPGTYSYICSLHVGQGMSGIIRVRTSFAVPPNVGGFSPSVTLSLLVAFMGLGLVLGGGLLVRRRMLR